jgi:hypothetical protein
MRCRRICGALARHDAIGETDSVERVAGQVESPMLPRCGLDPGNSLWMPEEVLRHAKRPAVNPSQRGGSGHANSRRDFLDS